MTSALVPLHLGNLHAYETVLLVLLAFGPFVVLGVVVAVVRRRDIAEEERDAGSSAEQGAAAGSAEEPSPDQAPAGPQPGADRSV